MQRTQIYRIQICKSNVSENEDFKYARIQGYDNQIGES